MKGGLDNQEADAMMEEDDGNTFFYQKWSVRIIFAEIALWFHRSHGSTFLTNLMLKKNDAIPTQQLDP